MDNSISLQRVAAEAKRVLGQFLFPCIFAVLLAVANIVMIMNETSDGAIIYYLTAAYLLSLMLKLWTEETSNKRMALIVGIVAHVVLLVDAIVLYQKSFDEVELSTFISHGAVYLALVLGIFFLPFVGDKDDIPSWNFVCSLIVSVFISFVVGAVMASGLSVLVFGLGEIFGIEIGTKAYLIIMVFCLQLLPMLLFLQRIPTGEKRHSHQPFVSGFISGATRYLFIPLVCCYILVLYVHLITILLTWELPNGAVSQLVTAMMCGIILVEFLLYPAVQSGEAKRFELLMVKWLPVAALPLVVLMTVGIVRRFDDYGVTANRLYMITLNLWFYAVCIGLYLTRARRIHWVSLSFCALLLLTSAHPFNYYELVRRSMVSKVAATFEKYPSKHLPLKGHKELADWLKTLPKAERTKVRSQLGYLQRYYNDATIGQWAKDMYISDYYNEDSVCTKEPESLLSLDVGNAFVTIPEGFNKVQYEYISNSEPASKVVNGDTITFTYKITEKDAPAVFVTTRKQLEEFNETPSKAVFYDKTGNIALCPSTLYIELDSENLSYYGNVYICMK